jgi:hypothetical protein
MGGAVVSIPTNAFINFDFYGLLGYSMTYDPGRVIEGSNNSEPISYHRYEVYKTNAGSFGFQAGTDINFQLSKRFELGIGVSYFKTRPEFTDVGIALESLTFIEIGTEVRKESYYYDVQILNIDAGLKILLGKTE